MAEPPVHGLRRRLSRWASHERQEAQELREAQQGQDCVSIAEAPDRERVRLRGVLRTVTVSPRGGAPALVAELFDGTGTLTVIWLGRRRIAGIGPGTSLQLEGRIGVHDKTRVMYNPRYELTG